MSQQNKCQSSTSQPRPLLTKCENCGIKDDLENFENVLCGITLCQDCADLPLRQIKRSRINWIDVDGEEFPPDIKRN
jgi:hypothetical protein